MDLADINLTDPVFWRSANRVEAFRVLRDESPVHWQEFAKNSGVDAKGFWAVTRYDDIVTVSTDAKTYVNGLGVGLRDSTRERARVEGWFLNMDAPEHFRLRQVVSKAFSPAGVQKMRALAESYAKELVAKAKADGGCDYAEDIAHPFPVAIVTEYLGAPKDYRARLQELTVTALSGDVSGAESAASAFDELNNIGAELAAERRKKAQDDVISIIVAAEVDGHRFTDLEVGYFFQLLVTAGIETTGTVGAQLLRLFLDNPEQMAIWAADPDGTAPTGIEEAVRVITPIIHFRRTAAVDTVLNGQPIAAGDKVVMWYPSGNQDERKFADPLKFDVTRNPNPHLGFGGGGRHTCLGSHFARMELPFLVKETLQQLGKIELSGEPIFVPSRAVNGLKSLPITFKPN
ncbi:cytochrome P450 [Mesorhizobium kowhaii]|uniref:cytochrome P450 n=1 Tax=Mesorhizobium kowhaii TaxID=1300272 RepID=UPI0035ED9AC5